MGLEIQLVSCTKPHQLNLLYVQSHTHSICFMCKATPTQFALCAKPQPLNLRYVQSHTHSICFMYKATPTQFALCAKPHPFNLFSMQSHTHSVCFPQELICPKTIFRFKDCFVSSSKICFVFVQNCFLAIP